MVILLKVKAKWEAELPKVLEVFRLLRELVKDFRTDLCKWKTVNAAGQLCSNSTIEKKWTNLFLVEILFYINVGEDIKWKGGDFASNVRPIPRNAKNRWKKKWQVFLKGGSMESPMSPSVYTSGVRSLQSHLLGPPRNEKFYFLVPWCGLGQHSLF